MFCATERTTSRSPRSTSTSVTASLSALRCAIASRCCWLWVAAVRHQVAVVEARRVAQHRLRHANVVVARRIADDAGRRVGDAREAAGELGARVLLDRGGEPLDHVVEQRDVVLGEGVRARDEQVGDAPKRGLALLLRLGGERVLDLVDQAW